MTTLIRGLQDEGVPSQRIHTESFCQNRDFDRPGAVPTGHVEVTFARSNRTLPWDSESRNLLEFAESNGIAMEAGCMFGECGACSTRIDHGDIEYNYTTAMQPKPGHCLPCSCRPKSAITLEA